MKKEETQLNSISFKSKILLFVYITILYFLAYSIAVTYSGTSIKQPNPLWYLLILISIIIYSIVSFAICIYKKDKKLKYALLTLLLCGIIFEIIISTTCREIGCLEIIFFPLTFIAWSFFVILVTKVLSSLYDKNITTNKRKIVFFLSLPIICIILITLSYNCIINKYQTNDCIVNKARQKNDMVICNKISDEQRRDWCIANVNSIAAPGETKNRDISSCNAIINSEIKDSCLAQFKYPDYKKEICDLMVGIAQKEQCISEHVTRGGGDVSLCDSLTLNPIRDLCYDTLAYSKRDIIFCEKISNEESYDPLESSMAETVSGTYTTPAYLRKNCFDRFYSYQATELKNVSACEKLPNGFAGGTHESCIYYATH